MTQDYIANAEEGRSTNWIVSLIEEIKHSNSAISTESSIEILTTLLELKQLVGEQNQMIAERERLFLEITENISEIITLFDVTRQEVLYISPSLNKVFGKEMKAETFYDNPHFVLEKIHEEDREAFKDLFFNPKAAPKELEFRLKEGKHHQIEWLRTRISPILNGQGKVTRHISVTQDITEIKQRDQLMKKWDTLGVMGQLAAGIAHELRNPLTSVKGFMQLLATETNNKYSDIILSELERIEYIMNEFLVLAKPKQEIQLVKENINDILQAITAFMNPEALMNNVVITTSFEQKEAFVYCEEKQIKQVIMNLIKNAIEAMPEGGNINIRTSRREDGLIAVEVQDEGVGMSKEQLERLTEPFRSTKEKGTGLGVMISYKIIEDHKGILTYSSQEGKGTTASILLPEAIE